MVKKNALQMIIIGVVFAIVIPLGGAPPQLDAMLHSQNLESGQLDDWELEPGWKIVESESSDVLASQGHVWAPYTGGSWSDYRRRSKIQFGNPQ
jgi:hypothetical protein